MLMKYALSWLLGVSGVFATAAPDRTLPLESFFAESSRFNEHLSPGGKWVAFLGPDDRGVNSLWAVDARFPGKPLRISPGDSDAVSVYFWIDDGAMLWQTQGDDGRPRFFTGGPHARTAREILTDRKRVVSLAGVAGAGDDSCILLGISATPIACPDLYRKRLHGDTQPERILTNRHRVFAWAFDAAGNPVVGLRWTDRGAKEILDLRSDAGTVVFRAEPEDDARLLSASADGSRVFVITNRGTQLTRLESIDLTNGHSLTLAADPLCRVDLEGVVFASGTREVLAAGYADEKFRWQSLSADFDAVKKAADNQPGMGNITSAEFSEKRGYCLLKSSSSQNPGSVWIYDASTGRLHELWRQRPEMDPALLCVTRPYAYTAGDGSRIPAFLTTPCDGKPPWPLVVFPHGGPNMRTFPGFDGRVQFLANRGYAVLQPNYRGSRGYGKDFMNAGDGQWGTGIMQTDLSDGVQALVRDGIAVSQRVAILGGSYGGYAALAGLAFTPDLYAAGICLFGVSDLNAHVAKPSAEWQPFAGDMVRRLGDPRTAEGRAKLGDRSPANHAAAFRAPLLIYHGDKDNLIPVDQALGMVSALSRCGKPVTCLLAPDEGHGFMRPESEMAVYRAIELFLHERIGGHVGPTPGEQVARRLALFCESGRALAGSCVRRCLPSAQIQKSSTYPQSEIP